MAGGTESALALGVEVLFELVDRSQGPCSRSGLHILLCLGQSLSITARCAGVSTSSASTTFLGLMITLPSVLVTSTKSPSCNPRARRNVFGDHDVPALSQFADRHGLPPDCYSMGLHRHIIRLSEGR